MIPTKTQTDKPNGQYKTEQWATCGALRSRWEMITADRAEEYLATMGVNRRKIPGLVDRYARDMLSGIWVTIHQGVAFNSDGELVDGQHRLSAIVQAKTVSIPMLVTHGLSKEAIIAIDRAKQRTLAHALQVLGYEQSDHTTCAIAKRMIVGDRAIQTPPTDSELRAFIEAHLAEISYAKSAIPGRVAPATVRAAVARAWNHVDPNCLRDFCLILTTGEGNGSEFSSVRLLREFLIRCRAQKSVGGSMQVSIYRKAANAIRLFADGKKVDRLTEGPADLFPLPGQASNQQEDAA